MLPGLTRRAFFILSPYPVYNSMDKLDLKIRRLLVDEGYLFPVTDEEIERALQELEEKTVHIPPHLDDPKLYLHFPEKDKARFTHPL